MGFPWNIADSISGLFGGLSCVIFQCYNKFGGSLVILGKFSRKQNCPEGWCYFPEDIDLSLSQCLIDVDKACFVFPFYSLPQYFMRHKLRKLLDR